MRHTFILTDITASLIKDSPTEANVVASDYPLITADINWNIDGSYYEVSVNDESGWVEVCTSIREVKRCIRFMRDYYKPEEEVTNG